MPADVVGFRRCGMTLHSVRLSPSAASIFWTLALVAVFGICPPAAFADAANTAEAFVQQNIDKGYVILNSPSLPADQRHAQFRNFIVSVIDVKRIGMFALGQYANGASTADIVKFTHVFADYTVAIYQFR